MEKGYLVDADVFAPSRINVAGLKIINGDYSQKELFERASQLEVVGDIIKTYQKYGQDKPAILFAVNIKHSEMLCAAFNRSGIPAIHCDQSHDSKFRKIAIDKLKRGEIKILCNVNIFSTGVDIPQAEVGIMARPTRSEVLYVQQLGRLLRPYKVCMKCNTERGAEITCHVCNSSELKYEKKNAIILDHGNNTDEHGMPFDIRNAAMCEDDAKEKKKKKKESEESEPKTKVCTNCFAYNPYGKTHCFSCGTSFKTTDQGINEVDGELVKLNPKDVLLNRMKARLVHFEGMGLQYDWKPNAKYFKLHKQFGDKIFEFEDELKLPRWVKSVIQKSSNTSQKNNIAFTKVYT